MTCHRDIVVADWDYSLGPPLFQRTDKTQPDTRTKSRRDMAPVRLVLSREPIGGIVYRETLECGHEHLGIGSQVARPRLLFRSCKLRRLVVLKIPSRF